MLKLGEGFYYSELFTDSFAVAVAVHHQHCMHVCVRTAVFRPHLAGAAHAGQPAGQYPALAGLSTLSGAAVMSLRYPFGTDITPTHVPLAFIWLLLFVSTYCIIRDTY